jgi:hypothetical protein
MRRAWSILALLLVAAAPAPSLVQRLAEAARKAKPDAVVTIVDTRTVSIKLAGRDQGSFSTDRVDQFCATNPADECENERATFVRNMAASLSEDYERLNRGQLRVLVRADDYVAGYRAQLAQGKHGVLVSRPVAPGVTAVLAADFPTTTRMVDTTDLDKLGLTNETAMALGEKQTVADLPPVPKLNEIKGTLIAITGFDYGASLMLLPERWHDLADASGGTLWVAVPSDGEVLIGTAAREDLPKLRTMVAQSFDHARRGISARIYRWSPQGWIVAE